MIVAKWQHRPHEGLRDPDHPGRLFTPNQKYAALVGACGYVPVALSGQDYTELLPAAWRAVNSYGIRINNRTYDAPELGPMRRRDSGVTARRGLWEVHRDPYDVSRVWVRDHRGGEWVQATWKYLNRAPVPFGDLAWDHVSHQLPKATEKELAEAVAALADPEHGQLRGMRGPIQSKASFGVKPLTCSRACRQKRYRKRYPPASGAGNAAGSAGNS